MKIKTIKDFYENNGYPNGLILFKGPGDLNSDSDSYPQQIVTDATNVNIVEDGGNYEIFITKECGTIQLNLNELEIKPGTMFEGWTNNNDGTKEAIKDLIDFGFIY